jgi:hypothetical protein
VGSSAISTVRVQHERHGDHRALSHAAGQLVRISVDDLGGIRHLDRPHGVDRAPLCVPARHLLVGHDRLLDLPAHSVERVERGERVLEDHRDPPAADRSQPVARELE